MGNDDTLISQLIEETYTESIEEDQDDKTIDLSKYFEKRLNQVDYISIRDYLVQHHLSHQFLTYQKSSGCYRLLFKDSTLDFPSNWSIFGEIKTQDFVFLNQSQDEDFLLDIFSEMCGSLQNIILVKESKEVQLVFVSDEEANEHVGWIKNYFEKKNQESMVEKTAA